MKYDFDTHSLHAMIGSKNLFTSAPRPFGVSGRRQILLLRYPKSHPPVYGLGEKLGNFDKSGKSFHFWNLDVLGDHPHSAFRTDYEPLYVAIPLLISRGEAGYFGIFLNNPCWTFIHAGLDPATPGAPQTALGGRDPGEGFLAIGSMEDELDLFIIPGPTLQDVTRRFSDLTGRGPLPPFWALGHHQCRWGYKSAEEIATVARNLHDARIPNAAMWCDIDYMDEYRVFRWHPERFSPEERATHFARIRDLGNRIVTIVDPGVKEQPGYEIYDEGLAGNLFCQSVEEVPFVGAAWPGRCHFPDFSLEETRSWWADHVASWLADGVDGIWNDMNDPSAGCFDLEDMRFQHGTIPHGPYHNQYGDLMARATAEGFARHDPNRRPFVLTRSACSGTQRFSAVWTGDNTSNEEHLAASIPMCLNLSLSGVAFCGPDVGGFVGDCSEQLLVTWYLAGFLFPFLRNHCVHDGKPQEPYRFSAAALDTIRACVETRSMLQPYLYNLFEEHERTGDPVMRPLIYHFDDRRFDRLDDQFLLGRDLMAAPFVDLESKTREVLLPEGWWFDLAAGIWREGGHTLKVPRSARPVLFVRDGAAIPMTRPEGVFPAPDLSAIDLHVFSKERLPDAATYYEDDGETHGRREGAFARWRFLFSGTAGGEIGVVREGEHDGLGRGTAFRVLAHGARLGGGEDAAAGWPFGEWKVTAVSLSPA